MFAVLHLLPRIVPGVPALFFRATFFHVRKYFPSPPLGPCRDSSRRKYNHTPGRSRRNSGRRNGVPPHYYPLSLVSALISPFSFSAVSIARINLSRSPALKTIKRVPDFSICPPEAGFSFDQFFIYFVKHFSPLSLLSHPTPAIYKFCRPGCVPLLPISLLSFVYLQ